MRKTVLVLASLFGCTFTLAALAQPAYIERKSVSPATASKLVDACIARAEQQKQIVGCAVVDIAGVLVDFHAMGGQATFAETAILKAKTAAHWQRATSALEADVNSQRNGASVWIGDFPRAGGVPIMMDGQVTGAIGVGGGGNSEEIAKAAMEAVLGKEPQSAAARSIAQPANARTEEQQIRDVIGPWLAAIERKDAAAIAQFYAPDGSILPPGAPRAEGRDAIAKQWSNFLALKNFALTFAPTKISVAMGGDMAYEIGTYSLSFENDRGPVRDDGKYVVAWKKVDGAWKAAADIFNSNSATP